MNQSLKAVLTLLGFAVTFIGVVYWTGAYHPKFSLQDLLTGIALCLLGAGLLALVAWAILRKDIEPDYLRKFVRAPFERDGLCFCLTIESAAESPRLNVYFQNRYSRPCKCTVRLRAAKGDWLLNPIEIDCGGGAFGVLRRWLVVPMDRRGKHVTFEVIADTSYSQGRGKMLRFREGTRVGKLDRTGRNLAIIGMAATGHLGSVKPARLRVRMPEDFVLPDQIVPPDAIEILSELPQPTA